MAATSAPAAIEHVTLIEYDDRLRADATRAVVFGPRASAATIVSSRHPSWHPIQLRVRRTRTFGTLNGTETLDTIMKLLFHHPHRTAAAKGDPS